jgi:hypothetical protein
VLYLGRQNVISHFDCRWIWESTVPRDYDRKYLSSTKQCIEFALIVRTIQKLLRRHVDIVTS